MPAQRPRASFEPIPPDFNLKNLVESTSNFHYVDRISCDMIEQQGIQAFERLVNKYVIRKGKPLVIDGYDQLLDPWTFTPKWLRDNCGNKVENARNLTAQDNLPLTMAHYLKNMGLLTNQFFDKPGAYKEKQRQRVYLKDIDCPAVWWDKLKAHIPDGIAYLNESTGEVGGPGAAPDPNVPGSRLGRGIAGAGDLMSSLPVDMRAENLMCYIGHEGTYTPAHREMCASLGHNIMVEASTTVSDDGKPEKPGSSIWFMTASEDREKVSEYWLSVLGHDIEVENHFAQVIAWKKAPFDVYVVEQCPGDLILIPPLAPHQVWNRGTRTIKVAWNRTTVETLDLALREALPNSRIVCRDEQYKNKAITYYTLQKYASLLTLAQQRAQRMGPDAAQQMMHDKHSKVRELIKEFKHLFTLYQRILLSEMLNPDDRDPKSFEYLPFDSNVTCAYCRCNIFNRFLTCSSCKDVLGHNDDDSDPYDVCLDCYAMGRSCKCISGLKWVEQFKWRELTSKYETWRQFILSLSGNQQTPDAPLSLLEERKRYGKKTLAEVCREQLKRRPWKDIRKADEPQLDDSEEEIVVNEDGVVQKIVKKKSKAWLKNNHACHVCCKAHPKWKMANCTTCDKWWCYGTLYRGWDKMPVEIMENTDWSCPHCLGICFAGNCRREGKMQPYVPKGTLLGHDTRKVADIRSTEALVDFSISNLNWLKDDDLPNGAGSARIQMAEADARNGTTAADTVDDDEHAPYESQLEYTMHDVDSAIDPALQSSTGSGAAQHVGVGRRDDDENTFARRLQEANSSLPPPPAVGSRMPGEAAPDGYAPLTSAGFAAPIAQMYPQPDEVSSYQYPSNTRSTESVEPAGVQLRPFKRRADDHNDEENDDITMSKHPKSKKPRLIAAGFRSLDLAEDAVGAHASKAKSEAQKQFEREKERKALEKAKAEGRFIMLQAAIRGKKRIVKLKIPGHRLGQLLALQAAKTSQRRPSVESASALGNARDTDRGAHDKGSTEDLLKSDVAPKKTKEDFREARRQKEGAGIIVTGGAKKALVPIEKDDNYVYRPRERNVLSKRPGATADAKETSMRRSKRASRGHTFDYEEIDIGSDEDSPSAHPPATGSNKGIARDRRSLPSYRQNRHSDDNDDNDDNDGDGINDENSTNETTPNRSRMQHQAREPAATVAQGSTGISAAAQLQAEAAAAVAAIGAKNLAHKPTAGHRPSVRPVHAVTDKSVNGPSENLRRSAVGDDAKTRQQPSGPAQRGRGRPVNGRQGIVPSMLTSSTEQHNRLAKLHALQMVESGSSSPQLGSPAQVGRHPRLISMADVQTISSDDDSDESADAIPARANTASARI